MSERLRRLSYDLFAYGRHLETCTKGRVIIPGKGWRADIRESRCSCGFDAALDTAVEIQRIYGRPSPVTVSVSKP